MLMLGCFKQGDDISLIPARLVQQPEIVVGSVLPNVQAHPGSMALPASITSALAGIVGDIQSDASGAEAQSSTAGLPASITSALAGIIGDIQSDASTVSPTTSETPISSSSITPSLISTTSTLTIINNPTLNPLIPLTPLHPRNPTSTNTPPSPAPQPQPSSPTPTTPSSTNKNTNPSPCTHRQRKSAQRPLPNGDTRMYLMN